jgi:hypothetical protein
VGVVNPENGNTLFYPELHNSLQLLPKLPPLGCVEVERVYVLILFGGILGVL